MQRLSPTENDKRIQMKLGDYSLMKQFIDRDAYSHAHTSRLIGISSSLRPPSSSQPYQSSTSGATRNSSSSSAAPHPYNNQTAPPPPQQRNATFAKPVDSKVPYNGRVSYPGQPPPNKHDVRSPSKTDADLFLHQSSSNKDH